MLRWSLRHHRLFVFDWRFLCKDLAEDGDQVGQGGPLVVCSLALDAYTWRATNLPSVCPVRQVVVIDPSFKCHMLTDTDDHILSRSHVDDRGLVRVGTGDP